MLRIQEYLKENRLIMDGAMGTYYATLYEKINVVSEYANIQYPDRILDIHKEYIHAGARLIKTNTFAANSKVLDLTQDQIKQLCHQACQIAKQAIQQMQLPVYCAGDIGPIPEVAEEEQQDIVSRYKSTIDVFLEEKVDAIYFETFPNYRYLSELSSYIKSKNSDVFVMCSFCVNKNGYTQTGQSISRLLSQAAMDPNIDAIGMNCGIGSGHMATLMERIRLPKNKYILAAPNAGYPEQMHQRMIYMEQTEFFKTSMKKMLDCKVAIVGACCGTTPAHIKELLKIATTYTPVTLHSSFDITQTFQTKQPVSACTNPILQKLNAGQKVIAVELDPPYDAKDDKVMDCARRLQNIHTDLITMADSPRGRSRIDSVLMSVKLKQVYDRDVMPHLCCRDRNMVAMRSAILGAYVNGIRNLLIVTGDPLLSEMRNSTTNVFDYNSIRLMEFVKEMNEEHFSKDPLVYGGALNYAGPNIEAIANRMEKKIQAGCSYFLTQPVYSEKDLERVFMLKQKTHARILVGILPFVSYTNANFIRNEFAGIDVPQSIVDLYQKDMSKEEAEIIGAQLASKIMQQADSFADGYYFMPPFNRVSLLEKIPELLL